MITMEDIHKIIETARRAERAEINSGLCRTPRDRKRAREAEDTLHNLMDEIEGRLA